MNWSLTANIYGGANTYIDMSRRFGDEKQFGAHINFLAGREDIKKSRPLTLSKVISMV